ncbi:MAG: hypothetical protein ACOC9E_03125 [Chloroflexota bacterium]
MRQRDILWFWLPLFASWLLMTAEGPIVSAAINRLPDEVIMLAAQGIVVSLAVTIESPIINLLATATALVKDRQSYLLVRRFSIHWAIFLTVVSALMAFTPLFDLVVRRWMGTPDAVARWVQPGLQIMVFWSAAIAWRRFLQGVLIHFDRTKYVAWGTAVRLVTSGGTAVSLALWTSLPGVILGALALMAGVIAEAIVATLAVRPLLKNELSEEKQATPAGTELSYHELFWFHLPLATTSLLTLLAQPLVTFSLARLDNPTRSLAAWPLIFQLILMARAAAMALPEAVIALTRGPETYAAMRRFAFTLAAVSTVGMILLVFTPLLPGYLQGVQDAELNVAELAAFGTRLFLLYPALFVLVSWLRGLLINRHATTGVNIGMGINLTATGVLLVLGVAGGYHGITVAAGALNIAIILELAFLLWRGQQVLASGPILGWPRRSVAARVEARWRDHRH